MTATTHLRALQALELAVRTGSLKSAAERLAITPAAVGQRIRALEDYLGMDLLVRGRSGIHPTAPLAKALCHLSRGFGELETVVSILDFQRVDEVHVVADTDWETLWLKPRLPEFQRANPNVLLCVNGVGDVPVRLGQEDCRIWFGETPADGQSDLLFADYMLPVSSPENTQRIRKLRKRTPLDGFPLLHLSKYEGDPSAIGWPQWIERYGYRKGAADRGLHYSQLVHALEAVRSNAGELLCGLALVLDEVQSGAISVPFPVQEGSWTSQAYRMRFPRHTARRSAVQSFRDWLLLEAGKTRAALASFVAEGG